MLFCGNSSSTSSVSADVQSASHSSFAGKRQIVFGMRNPFLAATITTAIPTKAPISDGSSGPTNKAVNKYGIRKARAVKIAKGATSKPCLMDRSLPKKRVMIQIPIKGITIPTITLGMVTHLVSNSVK